MFGNKRFVNHSRGNQSYPQSLAAVNNRNEHPRHSGAVTRRSTADIEHWLKVNEVGLHGKNIPRPVFEFEESTFPETIQRILYTKYSKPTAIQSICWPVALSGRDMISIARTGSGKTLGYLLSGIAHTLHQPAKQYPEEGPTVIILLPTRELAQQVEDVARDYCNMCDLGLACVFGGVSKSEQEKQFQKGIDICVATPGRLLGFAEDRIVSLQRCSYLVLDEADRMLDMGFEQQIRKIIEQIRPDRQTLMFTATWPKEVRALAMEFQTDPVFINIGSMEIHANHNIRQNVDVIEENYKPDRLIQLLSEFGQQSNCKTIIFVGTKYKADSLFNNMRRVGWPVLSIHGDKSQSERDYVMKEFREGRAPILLATEVAARGLDVIDVKYVINYDYPKGAEDYVHRIGRTARHDRTGVSYTFFTSRDSPKAKDLIAVLREANQYVPPELVQLANSVPNSSAMCEEKFGNSYRPVKRGFNSSGNNRKYSPYR
ncbi:DEAD/DEAH box helicase domain-containing protein [Ditylenchus destructor]|uniref:RNA helicase n=1 Tax=Ditylenchus destructor TaxID=166010 RepID=A0AAD4NDK5_9BILA|nr:DEAD/DEAH box helicase domain-containing protein [Ditylenchus destructor]